MVDNVFVSGAVDEAGEAEGIESEDDGDGSGIGSIEAEAREVGSGFGIGNGSFLDAIDDEVGEDLALLGWKVEIGFDASEGDADGFGRRQPEIDLKKFRKRESFDIVVEFDSVSDKNFIEISASGVEGVLISGESRAEIDTNAEYIDIGFVFFLCSVETDTDRTLLSVFTARRTAILNIFVKNFVFVHTFTSKIVRIIAFERL